MAPARASLTPLGVDAMLCPILRNRQETGLLSRVVEGTGPMKPGNRSMTRGANPRTARP